MLNTQIVFMQNILEFLNKLSFFINSFIIFIILLDYLIFRFQEN